MKMWTLKMIDVIILTKTVDLSMNIYIVKIIMIFFNVFLQLCIMFFLNILYFIDLVMV